MRRLIINVIAVLLTLVTITLFGCNSSSNEKQVKLQDEIIRLQSEVDALKKVIGEKDAQIAADNVTIFNIMDKRFGNRESANIVLTTEPNPVVCKNGEISWDLVITETNGVGVQSQILRTENYMKGDYPNGYNLRQGKTLPEIPPNGSVTIAGGFFPKVPEGYDHVAYVLVTFFGVDDNANNVKADLRIDFVCEEE
jgi:hypothetical protein